MHPKHFASDMWILYGGIFVIQTDVMQLHIVKLKYF